MFMQNEPFKKASRRIGVLFLFQALLLGCATYQNKVDVAREALKEHRDEEAVKLLEPMALAENDDQLVYLFDYATALQCVGRYKDSNESFQKADRLAEQKNYHSISRIAGSLLLSEEFVQYKGEDYERLLVNVQSAINYIMLNDHENALVEVRRLNEKLEYYRLEEKKSYEQNTAAIYLSALLWESDKNWDSAYIDFERAYKRDPLIPYIQEDLVRAALRANRQETAEKWMKKFSIKPKSEWKDKQVGELVLIFQQGWGPRKAERPRVATAYGFISPGFPMLQSVSSNTQNVRLEIWPESVDSNDPAKAKEILKVEDSKLIYSVQDTSMKTLEDAYAPLIAKRVAAYVAKEAIAQQVGKKNEGVGALLSVAMHLVDRADLRQWSTLPATIQVAKVYLRPGKYKLNIRGLLSSGGYSGEDKNAQLIEVLPGKKTFTAWRSFK